MTKAPESTFTIIAGALLSGIQASKPLASKDKDRPHLQLVRFRCAGDSLELSATDGKALARVLAPLDNPPEHDVEFSVQLGYLPTIVKALKRVTGEERSTLVVRVHITRFRITVTVGDAVVAVPNVAEQLIFPEVERVIPVPPTSHLTAVTTFGCSPVLLKRAMDAAAHVGVHMTWCSPETAESPIRFDIVDGEGGLGATYVVMPMRLGPAPVESEDGEEEPDNQLGLEGTEEPE